ncbi:hypothetical protein RG47T_3869 [Mucilaginibacter polytrichastri]|uniref:Uncharacterized protein n=1 Tax=Mucilaginibacter polytrichastri TaxID=1302689 RepID=A0A1Q6A364_9SPHI|nr:hypothetical protein RG47T_3869 [Mucilaginibacter polytrichastri]
MGMRICEYHAANVKSLLLLAEGFLIFITYLFFLSSSSFW